MTRHRVIFAGIVAGALLLAASLGWVGDEGAPDRATTLATRREEARRARGLPPQRPEPPTSTAPARPLGGPAPPPPPTADPLEGGSLDEGDGPFAADVSGVARSAFGQQDAILECLRQQEAASGVPLPPSVSIAFTLGNGAFGGHMEAMLTPDGERDTPVADACLSDLFAQVRYDRPTKGQHEFVWQIPTVWLDLAPDER